jgi:trimeric autotransporter adhesin
MPEVCQKIRSSRHPQYILAALFATIFAIAIPVNAQTYTISTFAGGALPVSIQGPSASLYGPQSAMITDTAGNLFFVDGNTILRLETGSNLLTLIAGNGTAGYSGDNGPAVAAQLHAPCGLAIDSAGNLYIASSWDNVVRKVSAGIITTIAGTGSAGFSGDNGPAAGAQLNNPFGLALDSAGNLYIADSGNNVIREISGGAIVTVAGNGTHGFGGDNGPATSALLNSPKGVAVDAAANLYIADTGNNRIRSVSAGVISTVAGNGVLGFTGDNGPAVNAQLNVPNGIALDAAGNLYIADYNNNCVRKVAAGVISTIAGKGTPGFSGDGGLATQAQLNLPYVVTVDSTGNLYIADFGNNRLRVVAANGVIYTAAGNGTAGFSGDNGSPLSAQLHFPSGIAFDTAGNLYFADYENNRVRELSAGAITTVAGDGTAGFSGDSGSAIAAQLNQPSAVAFDSAGNLYIADTGNNRIRKVTGTTITTFAGNGTAGYSGDSGAAAGAELNQPSGIAFDSAGNLYIADSANNRVRKVAGGTITTAAGKGTAGFSGDSGSAAAAQLSNPSDVVVDSTGNIYIADSGNNRVRKVAGSVISTFAGNGTPGLSGDNSAATAAQLNAPSALALGSGGILFIADAGNNAIRKVASGKITTIAGNGTTLGDGGLSTSGLLSSPQGVRPDSTGNIYIADTQDNRIRLLTPIPLSVTNPSSLADGTIGVAYAAMTFSATGGTGSAYTWSATGLPKGITFSTAGVLGGTPSAAATSSLQFTVKDSGGATASVTLSLLVAAPVPAISALNPASGTALGAVFTLAVTGTSFVTGDTIQWNGTPLTTKFVSATQLTASVAASLIAAVGNATITVTAIGASSGSLNFQINPPTPGLTTLSPTSAIASGSGFTLTVTGTGYFPSSQVDWNGAALATTYVSATQMTASVPGDLTASAGSASVLVNTGQLSSPALNFTLTPPPAIATLSPASIMAYSAAFTLTVNGTGFTSGATVVWNNSPLTTKFVSATQLTAAVPASVITGAGSVSIVVFNGAVTTNTVALTVTAPPPVITSLSPVATVAGSAALTLTVNGTGFTTSSTLQWNSAAIATTFINPTQLTAYISTTMIASTASISVTVSTGGQTSAATKFAITAPPVITTLSPASIIQGGPSFTLTVNGTGFVQGAQLQWNGASLPTTFVSATQLTMSVPAGLIGGSGSVTVQVNFGGASSNGVTFAINGPPAITSLSPSSAAVGGAAFTLTVNGAGFVTGNTIAWNGTSLVTKFVSATQLTAPVTAALIAGAGAAFITVTAGAVSSGATALTITPPPAITSLSPATVAGSGAPFTLTITGTAFLSGATVAWNGVALATTYVSPTQLSADVPANMASGTGSVNITAINPGPLTSAAAKLALTAATPAISTGGVVPIYSAIAVIQAGSWVSIYGTGLANTTAAWNGNFPTTLGGTSVKIDNKLAYLWSVSPTQINLQAPADTMTGTVNVVVTTASGSSTSTVTLAAYGPSFSLLPGSNYPASLILTPSGSGAYGSGTYDLAGPPGFFSFATRPVQAGEVLVLFGVGFGPTSPVVAPGKAYTGEAPTTNTVSVTIGGAAAKVLFSGITEAGVYQLNVVVPQVSSGDQPLLATVAGVSTPSNVIITVQ